VQVLVVLLALALALVFMIAGLAKVQRLAASDVVRERLSLPGGLWRGIGAVEVIGALGLAVGVVAIPELAVAACIGFFLLSVGAVVAHLRAGDRVGAVPPTILGVTAVVVALLVDRFVG
jgi:uncharacterized membrane protein YphA (DoxX/SURF4 family)